MEGKIKPFELMKELGMSKSTFYRYVEKLNRYMGEGGTDLM